MRCHEEEPEFDYTLELRGEVKVKGLQSHMTCYIVRRTRGSGKICKTQNALFFLIFMDKEHDLLNRFVSDSIRSGLRKRRGYFKER